MPWYRAGTVAVTLNNNTVTGTGTAFSGNTRVGDAFLGPDGTWYEITNVASNTVLAIAPNYRGATAASGTYSIVPVQGYTKSLADLAKQMLSDWGAALAGLGTVSTENVVPVLKGGTGATTQAGARTALGLGSVATQNVVPVENGGTGGATQAAARTGLGLGSSATLAAGSANGNVLLVGDRTSPLADTINVYGNSFMTWAATTAGAPETSTQGTMINLGYNSTSYGSQIMMSFFGRIYFRSGTYASAIMREIYHTGNTTKAADGTLKAI